MSDTLSGQEVIIAGVKRQVGMFPILTLGITSSGILVPTMVGSDGSAVTSSGASGTLTDGSGTITTGGTAQQVFAANSARKYFLFQNNSDTDQWINFGATAVASQPSIKIAAGVTYETPSQFAPTGTVSVIGATTGKTFTAKQA